MNKTCARCEKTVYPTEELKCLDKIWHKGCFKCQECGMTLNMRTYKGYGKLPYCESHVPKAKPTTMAETPELKRIAENTRLQSNVNYHADFERSKGKFTQVADDPETLRIKANTKIISNVAYHGDLEKKAQMEQKRTLNENGELIELPTPDNYQIQIESYASEMLPPTLPPPNVPQANAHYHQHNATNHQPAPQPQTQQYAQNTHTSDYTNSNREQYRPKYQEATPDFNHYNSQSYQPTYQQPNVQISSYPTQQKSIYEDYDRQQHSQQQFVQLIPNATYAQGYQQQNYSLGQQQQQQRIGKIQDYDPVNDGPRSPPYTHRPSATLIYNSSEQSRARGAHQPVAQQQRRIGSVADLDPLAEYAQQRAPAPVAAPPANTSAIGGRVYVAMYDYDSNDSDEVSFREGDLISNVSSIDEGWMTGQVLRTGHTGMLPANYVQLAPM